MCYCQVLSVCCGFWFEDRSYVNFIFIHFVEQISDHHVISLQIWYGAFMCYFMLLAYANFEVPNFWFAFLTDVTACPLCAKCVCLKRNISSTSRLKWVLFQLLTIKAEKLITSQVHSIQLEIIESPQNFPCDDPFLWTPDFASRIHSSFVWLPSSRRSSNDDFLENIFCL